MSLPCPMCGHPIAAARGPEQQTQFICPGCGTGVRDEAERSQQTAALRLVRPCSVALITLGALLIAFGSLGVLGFVAEEIEVRRQKGAIVRLWSAADLFQIVSLIISPFVGAILIIGGRKMRRLRSRRWALGAAIAAFVPTPLFIFGIPFGIWSLFVLTRPTVKAGFHQNRLREALS